MLANQNPSSLVKVPFPVDKKCLQSVRYRRLKPEKALKGQALVFECTRFDS